jgi:class 3 adenylate cyclase
LSAREKHFGDPPVSRRAQAIVLGDIIGTTAMLSIDGELKVLAVIQQFMQDVERLVADYDGRCIKSVGDCFLAVF